MILITERNLNYYRGACLTERVKGMNLIKHEETAHLHSADAERLGITDGSLVNIVSPFGEAECIAAVKNGMMPEGAVFVSFNRVNRSPLFPNMSADAKAYPIRVDRINKNEADHARND
jgi:predicted molibdopterin-dependent oxidoreductase YjgC